MRPQWRKMWAHMHMRNQSHKNPWWRVKIQALIKSLPASKLSSCLLGGREENIHFDFKQFWVCVSSCVLGGNGCLVPHVQSTSFESTNVKIFKLWSENFGDSDLRLAFTWSSFELKWVERELREEPELDNIPVTSTRQKENATRVIPVWWHFVTVVIDSSLVTIIDNNEIVTALCNETDD